MDTKFDMLMILKLFVIAKRNKLQICKILVQVYDQKSVFDKSPAI